MSVIRPLVISVAILADSASLLLAQDQPTPMTAPTVRLVGKAQDRICKITSGTLEGTRAAITEAKKNGTEKNFKFEKDPPRWQFSRRFGHRRQESGRSGRGRGAVG